MPMKTEIDAESYQMVERDGITAIIIHEGKILLLKRVWLPFISYPGAWTFVTGGRNEREDYLAAAYREIYEETGIPENRLQLLAKRPYTLLYDPVWKRKKWHNVLFVFETNTDQVILNYESTTYRWAQMEEIKNRRDYTNVFVEERQILSLLESTLKKLRRKASAGRSIRERLFKLGVPH